MFSLMSSSKTVLAVAAAVTFASLSSLTGCSSSDTSAPASVTPNTVDAAASASCTGVTGATVQADWTFAVSASTLNSGAGQLLTVNRCDTVVWTNKDQGTPHSVVGTGAFAFATDKQTGSTAGVALKAVQFTTAGTFTYDCGVHGSMMVGKITVN